jgi:hypothetical protein
VVFAGCYSKAPFPATGKWNGANVFGGYAYVLDADGARKKSCSTPICSPMSARAAAYRLRALVED